MSNKLSRAAQRIISSSHEEAIRLGSEYIGSEHLLLATLRARNRQVAKVFKKLRVSSLKFRKEAQRAIGSGAELARGTVKRVFSPRARRVLEVAELTASRFKQREVLPE